MAVLIPLGGDGTRAHHHYSKLKQIFAWIFETTMNLLAKAAVAHSGLNLEHQVQQVTLLFVSNFF